MRERPILCNAQMVRAILSGTKTQFRRVVKNCVPALTPSGRVIYYALENRRRVTPSCPYGQPGDRLWVRETFRLASYDDCACYDPCSCKAGTPIYRASSDHGEEKWKPSIFMPRWASRITLEVTAVRVERLQDISEGEAKAEGIVETDWGMNAPAGTMSIDGGKTYHPFKERAIPWRFHSGDATGPGSCLGSARSAFANLWESINGAGSWDANPLVWVVEFKRIEQEAEQ